MIKKAISLGVAKINVNTECQLAFADATRKYIEAGKDLEGKGFDPRKIIKTRRRCNHGNCKRKNGAVWLCWKSRSVSNKYLLEILTCLFAVIEVY